MKGYFVSLDVIAGKDVLSLTTLLAKNVAS